MRDYFITRPKIKRVLFLFYVITITLIITFLTGCATIPEPVEYTLPYTPGYGVYIDHIIMEALEDDELILSGPGPETKRPWAGNRNRY